MKKILMLLILIVLQSCNTSKTTVDERDIQENRYSAEIKIKDIEHNLFTLASDKYMGRKTGEKGQKNAANYIAVYYKKTGIEPPPRMNHYFQKIPSGYLHQKSGANSENILAYIPGSQYPSELLIISSHYDHLGVKKDGSIYNGADDNGSGTVAVMQIAKAFQKAVKEGNGPKRSVLFLHFTGEEEGLAGSKYYASHPVFPLFNTFADLNIDMIGRVDEKHKNDPEYIYIIGDDKLSMQLHEISEEVNNKSLDLELDYSYNGEDDPNRFYYRSDHYNFAKHNIPVIFYFNGIHKDYHKTSDTPDKINYEILKKRTELIFLTAWELANRKEKIRLDRE